MVNNILNAVSYLLILSITLFSVNFAFSIWKARTKRPFVYTGIYLTNFIVFNMSPWITILFYSVMARGVFRISSALSLSFIVMTTFAHFNLILFALRMMMIPPKAFRTINFLMFALGYALLIYLPLIVPAGIDDIMHYSVTFNTRLITLHTEEKMRAIQLLFALSALPNTYNIFNTGVLCIYLIFYLTPYLISAVFVNKRDINKNYDGFSVVYNITHVIALNIIVKCLAQIPATYDSYPVMILVWLFYQTTYVRCFISIREYVNKGYLYLR